MKTTKLIITGLLALPLSACAGFGVTFGESSSVDADIKRTLVDTARLQNEVFREYSYMNIQEQRQMKGLPMHSPYSRSSSEERYIAGWYGEKMVQSMPPETQQSFPEGEHITKEEFGELAEAAVE